MKFGFFLLLFIDYTVVNGQVVISGKMIDLKNKPLRGASVSIKDYYDGSATDSRGVFRFFTTKKRNVELQATISGYSSYTKILY
ncbi:MAG: carboxypeptidase-like regulatory domain-containing protein [Ferruginibacter sp.]